jgi:hypothetical protein
MVGCPLTLPVFAACAVGAQETTIKIRAANEDFKDLLELRMLH